MQEIPYSKIRQWFQDDRYQDRSESAYGPPQEQLLKFYNMLESCGDLTTVLDLGCGDGRNTIALARRGYHVTGIDVAGEQALLYRARQESLENVRFLTGDITLYPFDKESYDCVLCACVLHLLSAEQIEVVAYKAKKSLRQGGLIYLDVLTNIKRIFRDSGEEFTYTGLVNWYDRQAQEFFTRLFSNWSVLDMFSFHICKHSGEGVDKGEDMGSREQGAKTEKQRRTSVRLYSQAKLRSKHDRSYLRSADTAVAVAATRVF